MTFYIKTLLFQFSNQQKLVFMKKEVLTQVIVNFVLCFMLPAVAMPILYGLRGPEGSTTFIALSLIIVACYSCLVAVFVSLTQDSLSKTTRPLFMYLYMGITAALFLVIGDLVRSILVGVALGILAESLLVWQARKTPEKS